MTTTSELLLRYDQTRPRSQQKELGMSELGVCRKRAGYKLAGTTPSNPSGSMQAVIGTAIHDAVAKALDSLPEAEKSRYLFESEVHFAGLLGHIDRYEEPEITDVKTKSSRWLEHIKLHGPDLSDKWQVSMYGAALITDGKPVRFVRIDYIARDTGEEWMWRQAFNPQDVRDALEWLRSVQETPLDMLPRDHDPESEFCRSCPFLELCWVGAVPGRKQLSVLFVEDPDAEKWAAELWQARAEEKAAKKIAKLAAGALDAIRPIEGVGRVQCGEYTLDFRSNGLYFVAGAAPIPAVGYEEGDA